MGYRSASLTNISLPLRSHSIRFSSTSYSFKLEADYNFVMRSRNVYQLSGVLNGRAKTFVILVSHWLSSAYRFLRQL